MRFSPLLALTLLGCQQDRTPLPAEEAPSAPAASGPSGTETRAAAPSPTNKMPAGPESLVGEYRIAGVGGTEIDLPHALTTRITADAIEVDSGCVNFAWTYAYDRTALATERRPAKSCERALLPDERAVAAAFDAATQAARTPANGIALTSGGHSVLLFSQ